MTIAEAAHVAHVWITDGTKPEAWRAVRILIHWPTRTELFEVDANWRDDPSLNKDGGYFECSIWGDAHECALEGTPWRYREEA